MPIPYTQMITDSVWSNSDAVDILKDLNDLKYSRPFSEGLTNLMRKYSYSGPDDILEKTSFLYEKLSNINVSITKQTINDWFTDKRRPSLKSDSRRLMFQICFALSVSFEDVFWFFQDVYFDRCFNCHIIDEAVYYYCFKNKLDKSHADNILKRIDEMNILSTSMPSTEYIYTKEIQNRLDHCSSDDELIIFFKENMGLFNHWNQTATQFIKKYLSDIQGSSPDDHKQILNLWKNKTAIPEKESQKCGLIIQELIKYEYDAEYISGKNITSIDFMLDCIFGTTERFHKNVKLPVIIRRNFPSKKVFSELLNNIEKSKSYDSIRKCIIFLKFYTFWCKVALGQSSIAAADLYDTYKDETNDLLSTCGYEELSIHNLYDRLFFYVSLDDHPLDLFRNVIEELINDDQ